MFAAPPVIETRVFATLPQQLRITNRPTLVTQIIGREVDSFLEGPSFDRYGNLYCVDIPYGRILRISPHGEFSMVAEYDGLPNGLKIHKDGRLFIADRRHGIVVIDPQDPKVEYGVSGTDLERFSGPNDLVFSAQGHLYFTDQGMSDLVSPRGRVFRLGSDGRLDRVLDGLVSPNGIAIDGSGRNLYVALTRSNCILKALITPEGRVSRVQNFIQLSGGGGPDGIAVDSMGGLVVAHPGVGVVWCFNNKGEPTLRINLCRGLLGTNLAFGGPDGRRLFITESDTGTIHTVDLPVAGTTMFSHMS